VTKDPTQSRASTGYEPLFYALNWDKWLTITDMTDSKLDEVKDDRKLKGKTNFVSWKREFERVSKADDIFEYLTGEEVVPPSPRNKTTLERPSKSKRVAVPEPCRLRHS